MYRDDDLARAERIDRLEDVVARQEGEIASLLRDLADRDRVLREIAGRAGGRAPAHRRWLRDVALIGCALVAGAACLWWLGAKGPDRTARTVPHQEPIYADPLDVPPPPPNQRTDPARGDETTVVEASIEVRARCAANDPLCRQEPELVDETAQKRALVDKATAGRASETELRMLKAICMNDGDRACRDVAVALLGAAKR